jgi:adenosylcobinamide-GDP ribazoletransferase
LPWFSLVGFLLGLMLYGISVMFGLDMRGQWPGGTAVLVLIAGVALTRGLHLDGLADWADGFWGARDKERILQIMKDPHKGSFGVIALVCVILAKWVCLSQIITLGGQKFIVTAMVVSRAMQAMLAATQPYARAGEGTAAAFVREARPAHGIAAVLLGMLLLLVWHGPDWQWPAALVLGMILAGAFGFWCRVRIGGVTGDILGACSELVETSVLALGAIVA